MPNSKINYLEIIKKAAGITWKNKQLWRLGFLILISGTFSSFFQYSPRGERIEGQKIIAFTSAHKELIILLILTFILLWIILGILGIIAKGGLIKSIARIDNNEKTSFREGFQDGKKYFWQVFFIGILSVIFVLAVLVVFMIPIGFLFYNKAYFLGGFLSFLALLIFVPLIFLVTFVKIYGYFYAILSDLPLGEAIENAYALLRKNIVPSIIISFTFLVIGTFVTVLAFILLVPVIAFFFAMGALLFFLVKQIGVIITIIISLIVILSVLIVGGSVYQVFAHSLLVMFFKKIALPKDEEVIEVSGFKKISPTRVPDPIVGN